MFLVDLVIPLTDCKEVVDKIRRLAVEERGKILGMRILRRWRGDACQIKIVFQD